MRLKKNQRGDISSFYFVMGSVSELELSRQSRRSSGVNPNTNKHFSTHCRYEVKILKTPLNSNGAILQC